MNKLQNFHFGWTIPLTFFGLTCSNEWSAISQEHALGKSKGPFWFHIDFSVEKKKTFTMHLCIESAPEQLAFYISVHNLTGWPVIMLLMQNALLSPQLWMAFIRLAVWPNSSISPPWFENFREREMTSPSSPATFHCSGGGEVVGGVSEKLPTHTNKHTHTTEENLISVYSTEWPLLHALSFNSCASPSLSLSLSLFFPLPRFHSPIPWPLPLSSDYRNVRNTSGTY